MIKQYYDDVFKGYGFLTPDMAGIGLIRSMVQSIPHKVTKEGLIDHYNNSYQNAKMCLLWNAWKIIGYIPILSIFTGLFNIWVGYNQRYVDVKIGYYLRAALEIFSFGFVNIPYDVFVTYQRMQNPILLNDVLDDLNILHVKNE
jgi:hypothetical protein